MQGLDVITVVAAVTTGVAVARRSRSGVVQRDPQRAFSEAQRQAIFARAGHRCEHTSPFGRRCTASPSHADHVHPWSKGGATTLANGQALCQRHNLEKGSRAPSAWSLHRLERRRRSYFPPGEPNLVAWRVGNRYGGGYPSPSRCWTPQPASRFRQLESDPDLEIKE